MYNYTVLVRLNNERQEVGTDDYLLAYKIFHLMRSIYPNAAIVDIVDNRTGEVFQTTYEN